MRNSLHISAAAPRHTNWYHATSLFLPRNFIVFLFIICIFVLAQDKVFAVKYFYPSAIASISNGNTYCQNTTPTALSVTITNDNCGSGGNGTDINISVSWYSNTVKTPSGGILVSGPTISTTGTTTFTYTPSTASAGTLYYYFVVSWSDPDGASACTSGSITSSIAQMATVIVNTRPTAPTIGTITQPTCATATGSVALSGLPSGAWTVTGSPSGSASGSGTTGSVTGLAANTTYTFTVNNGTCTSVASGNAVVNAQPTVPSAPTVGTITQPTCATATASVALSGLPSGSWTVTGSPSGSASGTGTTGSVTGLAANTTYTFTVNNGTCTSAASGNAVVNAQPVTPSAPTVGTITQPTCATATGSVALSGLPSGAWTVTGSPSGSASGSGTTGSVTGLAANTTYTFTVNNGSCTSAASGNAVVNAQPTVPSAPTIGTITQPTCATATASVALSGLPSGSWTVTGSPSGSASGSGTTGSVTGLAANATYTFTVNNGTCTSAASGNAVVNAQPVSPSAPTAATHTPAKTQIVWNWNTVSGATGYKYSTTNNYSGATDNGTSTTYTQTGLTCATSYTLYVWAYNSCGNSAATTLTQSTSSCGNLVISQVYGGGGNSGAPYLNDFIEIFNPTCSAISIAGWSVQYQTQSASTWSVLNATLSSSVAAGKYYLIQLGSGGTAGASLPAPDATGTDNLSATQGKIALVNSTTVLTSCTDASIVDKVGFGSTSVTCNEGGTNAPAPSNTTAILRGSNGCTDTDVNSSDFAAGAPNPRNIASAANSSCPTCGPTITVTPTTLSGFIYMQGSGPSTEQTFTVSGSNLTNDISIAASTNYEISKTSGSGYATPLTFAQSGGTVTSTTVYVRLKSGLSVGTYNSETITASSTGATVKTVTCSGAVTAVPSITLADNGTQVTAANVSQNTTAHVLHKFSLAVTTANATLTGIDVTTAGTYIAADITNLKVRYSTDATLDAGDATLSTYTNPGAAGAKTFPSFSSQAISSISTGYIFITADISAAATVGNTISLNAVTTGQLTFASGAKSGSTTAGGLQTFVAPTSCGSETFASSTLTASYLSGNYTGDNSLSWSYVDSRNEDTYGITGKGIMFKPATTAKLTSGTASGGIGNFTCSLKKAFTGVGNRQVELFINGVSVGTSIAWDNTTVQTFTVNNINVSGDVVVEIRNKTSFQVVVDDISWACYLSTAPTITITPSTLAFSDECINVTSGEKTYTASGINLTTDITINASMGYQLSTTSGSGFSSSITLPQVSGTVANTIIYVRFTPTLVQSYPGSITHTSTGATTKNVAVSGTGVNGPVITNNPSNQSVSNGGNASFNIAISNASATYQWQENQSGTWANLSDGGICSGVTTNSLGLDGITGAMSGFMYRCTITSCAANVTSSSATLTISSGSSLCGLEEFDNGTTAPTGWTFKSIGDIYSTATNYGINSPSLKLDATGDSVITANVSNVTELSVWVKGMGTNFKSKLYIDGYNSTTSLWENIALIGGSNGSNEIPTTGTVYTYTSVSSYSKFSFSYDQGVQGNLGLDDVNITCTSSNTITTGTISTPPFGCNCTTGSSGSVSFTSSGTFSSNTYYAQLSNASGSFSSPMNIGTLVSNANSGTINFTIPPGTPSGSNYLIRVISNGPWSIGSFSSPFTINLTGGPCSFFEIESILVDACEPAGGWEGENEMFRFKVGATNLNTSTITVAWPNNTWLGICQNATTAATVAAINATIIAGGQLLEPTGGDLPAGAEVMFFTNTLFNYTLFNFSQLNYTLYAIFQCPDNRPGHFANYSATPGTNRTLTLTFTGFGSDAVTYDAHLLYNGDGATVDFDVPGNPTYSSLGTCETVPIFSPLPVSLLDFSAKCDNNSTTISWSTASETNNDYFTIEKSFDTETWTVIGIIKGAGNSNSLTNYKFTDPDNAESNTYYRLKQTDFDGKSETFIPIAVKCNDNQSDYFSIYPNPAEKQAVCSIYTTEETDMVIEITNYLGYVVYDKAYFLPNGLSNIVLDVSQYTKGIYNIVVRSKDGKFLQGKKLVLK